MATKEFNLIIVRHGETDANKEGRMQGQINTDLNATGREQAAKCGKRLKDEPFDEAFSSDLNRAAQTCDIILSQNETSASSLVPERLALIRERSFGPWEGKLVTEFSEAAKKAGVPGFDFKPEGVETKEHEENRVNQFFERVFGDVNSRGYKDILVVSHGGLIYKMNCHLYKTGVIEDFPEPSPLKASPPNTGVTKLSLKIDTEGRIVSGKCLVFMSGSHLDD